MTRANRAPLARELWLFKANAEQFWRLPMDLDPQSVRERMVVLVVENATRDLSAGEVIAMARGCADFILGTNDAEILRAARDLANKVGG